MANLSRVGLRALLHKNVVELIFLRRNPKSHYPKKRRMLCTLDVNFLLSLSGKLTLNYVTPHAKLPYNALQHKVLVVWDLLWQGWRAIPMESITIINVTPTHNKKDQEAFWALFNAKIAKMSSADKVRFMKS